MASPEAGFSSVWQAFDGGLSSTQRDWASSTATEIPPELFTQFQILIYELSGVWISHGKSGLLAARLAHRLRATGVGTLRRYYELVTQAQSEIERERMVETVTCGTPRFFRVPQHFEFVAQRLFPRYRAEASEQRRPRRLRIWSAGCGNGEEPFSIAMLMRRCFPESSGWELEVLATDTSGGALQRGREAVWPVERAREIPQDFLEEFMLKGEGQRAGLMSASEELRSLVRFGRMDLLGRHYPLRGLFDLILCRGVLDFFDQESRARVVRQIAAYLSPSGFLMVDDSEDLSHLHPKLGALVPGMIYGEASDSGHLLYDFRAERP